MNKKFKEIGNLAVFQNFEWTNLFRIRTGNVLEFKQINILYGRNYSGKTTLSRILRAIECGKISDKFENPAFCVSFADNTEIKQDALTGHGKNVRVFNDDFVRDNLKFIINPDESIEPFAILGVDNLRIEEEINVIQSEIGSKEEGGNSLNAQLKTQMTTGF
jgi:wobble nucleotide-excising tRNase